MSEHDTRAGEAGYEHEGDSVSVVGHASGHRRARRRSGCLPILVVLLIVAAGGYFVVTRGIDAIGERFGDPEDFAGPGSGAVTFEVGSGDSIAATADSLEARGVVASSEAFVAAAEADGRSIQPGAYRLKRQMAAADALRLLVSGSTRGTQFTFTAGKTVEEIVDLLARDTDIPRREFEAVLAEPAALDLPADAEGVAEGYLFPGSYLLFSDSTAESILVDMVDAWRSAAEEVDLAGAAERLGYTQHELMTIAALIEAEGSLLDQEGKGKIARVVYNRLEIDPNPTGANFLNIDATVNFALGEDVVRLSTAQIDSVAESPYNTYRTEGLPPGPIGTMGLAALEATVAPVDGPWFYYATVNLRTGETKFVVTPEEAAQLSDELTEYCATQSDRC